MSLLSVENLSVRFETREGVIRAVDGLSFGLEAGETLGVVGESGSGKSVACSALLGLLPTPPARIGPGEARFLGQDLLRADAKTLRDVRGRRIAMIFQDPMTALNPWMPIGDQVAEPLLTHGLCDGREARERSERALRAVGIADAKERLKAWPHELSGGMRQRVMIAMALTTAPELLIADEPTTALDVTVQAQILRLIAQVQRENPVAPQRRMGVILVSHDLGVVAGTCDRVLVMYAGREMESGPAESLFRDSMHPYTRALLRAIPGTAVAAGELYAIPGEPPDPARVPPGCPFAPRCDCAESACFEHRPEALEILPGRRSACFPAQAGRLSSFQSNSSSTIS